MPNDRLIFHGEGFNFLTFASSLHANWTTGGSWQKIVIFSFKSNARHAAAVLVVLTRPCNIAIRIHLDQLGSVATTGVFSRPVAL